MYLKKSALREKKLILATSYGKKIRIIDFQNISMQSITEIIL